jgi:hypothetical protein
MTLVMDIWNRAEQPELEVAYKRTTARQPMKRDLLKWTPSGQANGYFIVADPRRFDLL